MEHSSCILLLIQCFCYTKDEQISSFRDKRKTPETKLEQWRRGGHYKEKIPFHWQRKWQQTPHCVPCSIRCLTMFVLQALDMCQHTLQCFSIQPVWLQDSAVIALLKSHGKPDRHLNWNVWLERPECALQSSKRPDLCHLGASGFP